MHIEQPMSSCCEPAQIVGRFDFCENVENIVFELNQVFERMAAVGMKKIDQPHILRFVDNDIGAVQIAVQPRNVTRHRDCLAQMQQIIGMDLWSNIFDFESVDEPEFSRAGWFCEFAAFPYKSAYFELNRNHEQDSDSPGLPLHKNGRADA